MIKTLQARVHAGRQFIDHDLWRVDLTNLPRLRRQIYTALRVVYIVVRGFLKDNCVLHASALTFITLMSMVPMLGLIFSLAKGLGAEKLLIDWVNARTAEFPPQLLIFRDNIFDLVQRTNFMAIGAVGSLLVFYTVVRVMTRVESSFNLIWGVRSNRPFSLRFAYYISVLMIIPFVILLVSTVNASLSSQFVRGWMHEHFGPLAYLYYILLQSAGLIAVVLAFSMLYFCLPNTRVKLPAGLIGGLVGGISWLAWQWFCINVQVWITKYNNIYGAFASLPVSLFWLQVNWMIVLFGAEVSFAVQNFRTYSRESGSEECSHASRQLLAFIIFLECARQFVRGAGPWRPTEFQARQQIPIRLIQSILFALKNAGLLVQTEDGGYTPGRDLQSISLSDVDRALSGLPDSRLNAVAAEDYAHLHGLLARHQQEHQQGLRSTSFAQLVAEAK